MDNWDQIITQNASQQTLEAFLAPLNLGTDRNYSQFLISIGYGDVNEFGRFDQEDRKTFEMLAIDKGMEDWKAFKISRNMKHFAKAHQSGWLVGDEQGGTQPLYAPPPAQPQAGSSPQQDGAPPAAPQPPGATEPEEQRKRLHAERVKEWLAGTPGGNRPVYGRDNGSLGLQPWQIALNEAACRLAIEQPWLVRFEGKRPKVGELQKAAGTIAAEGFGFAKKNGSRAGGAQGEAGKRAAPEKAAGGLARRPAVSITPNQRDARLMLIPKLMSDIDDMISALTKQKDEFIAANNSAAAVTVMNTLSEKRVEKTALQEELRQLQAKGKKAATDKRRSAGEGALLEQLSTPEVSAENIPAATTSELETVKRLADQLAVKDSFAKESTEIGRLRVSPIEGITLEEYIMAARHLCSARGHNDKTVCACNVLIRAATILVKKRGARVSLRQLWKDAGGSSGVTKARNILDQLMHIPAVAVRLGTSTGEQTGWIVMAKEPDVNYKMLDGMVGAVEPALSTLELSSRPMISTARLRALKRLCSTDSDRKLVELAVLEGQGTRARRELLGTNRAPSREACAELEEKIEAALATFEVCAELANLQTLSEITARIGCGQITEQDIADEVARLEADERKYAAEAEGGEARGDSGAAAAGNGLGTGAAAAGEGEDATDLLEAATTGPEEPDASWAAEIPSAEDVERVRAELEAMGITNLETLTAADADAKTILGDNWDEYAMSGIDFWSANTPYSSDGRLIRPLSGSHITPFT